MDAVNNWHMGQLDWSFPAMNPNGYEEKRGICRVGMFQILLDGLIQFIAIMWTRHKKTVRSVSSHMVSLLGFLFLIIFKINKENITEFFSRQIHFNYINYEMNWGGKASSKQKNE